MALLSGSPLFFSSVVSLPLALNPCPLELFWPAEGSLVLLYLAVETGIAYLLVEELGDEVVQPSLLIDSLLIIPRSGVDIVSGDEFEVIHPLEH